MLFSVACIFSFLPLPFNPYPPFLPSKTICSFHVLVCSVVTVFPSFRLAVLAVFLFLSGLSECSPWSLAGFTGFTQWSFTLWLLGVFYPALQDTWVFDGSRWWNRVSIAQVCNSSDFLDMHFWLLCQLPSHCFLKLLSQLCQHRYMNVWQAWLKSE